MRIGIIGTGAMASIFGGGLMEAGHDVVFVGKNAATVATLNEHGLTVDRDGSASSHYAASAVLSTEADADTDADADADAATATQDLTHANSDAASAGICDIVLVLVKSYDTASAVTTLAPLVGPETIIVTLQNGVGAGEIIAAALPDARHAGRIVQGVTYQGGTIIAPGHVYHHSTAKTLFGPFGTAATAAAEQLAALWGEVGWGASVTQDIEAEVWKKVVVNGVNAIAATTRLPSRAMTESPAVRQLVEDVVLEGMTVAHALGYTQLDERQAVADILRVLGETPDGRTSMLQDVDAGRRTEIDVLNGAVIAAAERLGIDVPLNRALSAQVTAWEVEQGLRAP
jgi:2-dehydropantoate 2-reductase